MSRKDYIDSIYDSTLTEHDDAHLDMRIDFSNKYLPNDREETKRRIKADMALSSMLAAYERDAFINGYMAAEKRLKKEEKHDTSRI